MSASVIIPEAGTRRITRLITEASLGVTPTGAWDILRNTGGNGIGVQYVTQESEELGGTTLGIQDQIRVDTLGNLDYPFEYSSDGVFDDLWESLLADVFTANVLTPGDTVKTFSFEDEFPTVKQFAFVKGSRITQMQVVVESGQPVKGTFQAQGSSVGIGAQRPITVSNDIDFTAPNQIVSTAVTDPFTALVAGDFVLVTGAGTASNNGYYKITAVGVKTLTVDGVIVNDSGDNPVINANPVSLVSTTGGSNNAKDTSVVYRAGLNVDCKIDNVDVLQYGFRIPQLTLTVATPNERGREITEDSPYVTVASDRTVEISFQWHVINMEALRRLDGDTEFPFQFTIGDGTNSRQFKLPRAKFAEGSPGPAGRGTAIMTGTARMIGLLSSGVNLEITRAP